jgi:hypothetical protein
MPADFRHLLPGENPPTNLTQELANTLPSWTDARTYGLPQGPLSLTAVTAASAYNASLQGSHWQRLMNTFAIELELLDMALDENLYERFLEYPGRSPASLDLVYRVSLQNSQTGCTGASATLEPSYLGTVQPDGTETLNPNRVPQLILQQCFRLFDFYYGLSQIATYAGGASAYSLPNRVGVNEDGSRQIEWIYLNGPNVEIPSYNYSVAGDLQTLTFTASAAPASGSTFEVHYTTYDVFYVLPEDVPYVYTREPYFEVWLQTTGPTPNGGTAVNNLAPGEVVFPPVLHMVWTGLDECGTYLNKPRLQGEDNLAYQRRLIDAVLYPSGPTLPLLRNALATELGLVNHVSWGIHPNLTNLSGATASSPVIAIGTGNVYGDTILIDRLPLPYYSVVTTLADAASGTAENAQNQVVLSFPQLGIGGTASSTLQLMATGGIVVPGAVPLLFTNTVPASAQPIYDLINPTRDTTSFGAPTNRWYPGSLQVWKNGYALVKGVDYSELSTSVFTLSTPATAGDQLQLGYIYDDSLGNFPLELEAQPDVLTDLAPIMRISAHYTVDPTPAGVPLFPNYTSTPPDVDPAAIPTNATWTLTVNVTNSGSATAAPFDLLVTLPPTVTWDGQYLSMSPFTETYDLRYIDGDQVWVNNLTDPQIQDLLYTAQGAATPLLRAFAQEITTVAPLEWGDVRWDRNIWHTLNERYSDFGFLPNLFDPQYAETLSPQRIFYSGTLTTIPGANYTPSIFGSTIFGESTFSATPSTTGYYVDFNTPGTAISTATINRFMAFQAGIGQDTDCFLSIAFPTDIAAATATAANQAAQQRQLNGTTYQPTPFVPLAQESDAWFAMVAPGVYYLNQEEHYFFSQPIYAETVSSNLLLNGAMPNTPVYASIVALDGGFTPLRRVYFTDDANNYTLTTSETVSGNGTATVYLTYEGLENINVLAASDGLTYTPSATGSLDNSLTFTTVVPDTTELTISYQLQNSFYIDPSTTDIGSYFVMDQDQPTGVLILYEGGSGRNLTSLPLHPYFNPRNQGFVYVTSDFYLPTTMTVIADPASVVADGVTTFSVRVQVTDAAGNATNGLPVIILVSYREGTQTYNGTTDYYGQVSTHFPASEFSQVAQVTAAMQLFDDQGNPISTLLAQTFIEMYTPFE